ncbi:hypothetical protein MGYG_05885 [Nannizzia gypsea CBS 118893]|uniref:Zn(2)-C6 fungal-type domain-containing protein n=1 Tax=Arthroderma gypseum (strain ATCC MYA-4604 / CBS 118893) TaxID=535722 RepID=E4UZU7_ARTGP|nr:hypothetical protein MGYG_05885 [Nannizzia gypsea CBS 118893]EFR02884.1 hypothetical protein MGYG_05885 [Nannizzia gypsea CBS 118893]
MDNTCYKREEEEEEETKILRQTRPTKNSATKLKREESESAPCGKIVQTRSRADCEGKTNGTGQRRRTQVACSRCRRRKIKCSGDLGNNQACSNCKSSGTTTCLFLRVNSSTLHAKPGYDSWVHPFSNSSPPGTCEQQQACDAHMLRGNPPPIHGGSHGLPAYSGMHPGLEYGIAPESSLANRAPSYSPNYPFGYGDEGAYHSPFPSYALPSSTGPGAGAICGTSAPTRSWRLPTTVDPTNGAAYPDHDGSGSLSPSFPFMSSLSLGQDRTLPKPTTSRNNNFASLMEGTTGSSSLAVCPNTAVAYKQEYQLATESESTRAMTSNVTPTTLAIGIKLSPSPVNCGFGYIPLSNGLQTCVTSSAPFPVNEVVDTPVNPELHANNKTTRPQSSTNTCVSEYIHSTSRNHRPGQTRPSGGILVSGEVYQRPQYTISAGTVYSADKVAVSSHLTSGTSSCY